MTWYWAESCMAPGLTSPSNYNKQGKIPSSMLLLLIFQLAVHIQLAATYPVDAHNNMYPIVTGWLRRQSAIFFNCIELEKKDPNGLRDGNKKSNCLIDRQVAGSSLRVSN